MTRPTVLLLASLLYAIPGSAVARGPRVFKVCNRRAGPCGPGGGIRSISRAIKRAKPGDWVLIWPGVYHEKGTPDAGVMITTPGIHVRGMDRNLVIIDGSNGTAAAPCPAEASLQDLTARNGIEAFKVTGVTELPAADAGANDAALAPDTDARPVRGCAEEPVVPLHGTTVVSPLRSGLR